MAELPEFVSSYRDRHGKQRFRFRRCGFDRTINAALGSAEFVAAYDTCLKDAPHARRSPGSPVDQMRQYFRSRKWSLKGEYVYFIGTLGAVKIGFSSGIVYRIATLAGAGPHRIRFLAAVPGGRDVEKSFHERFATDRKQGEWFRRSETLRAAIKEIRQGTSV